MMELGKRQTLQIVKTVDFGVYLAEAGKEEERVLLPRKQVPAGAKIGSEVEVFLYKDSSDRMIATTAQPMLTIGETAVLKVVQTGKIGAFLDWGLEKDLFLPYKEQTAHVHEGDNIIVALYIDKSERLCATMKVYPYLRDDSPYEKDDIVSGRVYEVSARFGAYIAVDDRYTAMISPKEDIAKLRPGQVIDARVVRVKDDGKLDLTMRQKAYLQMDTDAQMVYELFDSYDGVLPFTDKSDAQLIHDETGLSKNAFKRAVGRLYKERKIIITDTEIRRL
jgi:hypothetical protein